MLVFAGRGTGLRHPHHPKGQGFLPGRLQPTLETLGTVGTKSPRLAAGKICFQHAMTLTEEIVNRAFVAAGQGRWLAIVYKVG